MIYLLVDIIIFAAIAFYIFFKLNKQLGKIDEEEKKNIEAKIINMNAARERKTARNSVKEKVIGSKSTESAQQKTSLFMSDEVKNLDENAQKNLSKILQKSNIDSQFFLSGAKSAFESILQSFANDKLEDVKFLLTDKIYKGFKTANDKRKAQGKNLTTNIISFDEVEFMSANIAGNNASIAIKFLSQQINYISSAEGEIIVGSKDEINQVEDIWTFKRDLQSSNPNWLVCATSHS